MHKAWNRMKSVLYRDSAVAALLKTGEIHHLFFVQAELGFSGWLSSAFSHSKVLVLFFFFLSFFPCFVLLFLLYLFMVSLKHSCTLLQQEDLLSRLDLSHFIRMMICKTSHFVFWFYSYTTIDCLPLAVIPLHVGLLEDGPHQVLHPCCILGDVSNAFSGAWEDPDNLQWLSGSRSSSPKRLDFQVT